MRLTIHLPPDAEAAIDRQVAWSGPVRAELDPEGAAFAPDVLQVVFPRSNLDKAVRAEARAAAAVRAYAPTESERLLIEAWNDSEFIREHAAGESRNHPVPAKEVHRHLPGIRRAMRLIGLDRILAMMEIYFAACLRREHLWGGKNHGYSHLGGFLRGLVAHAGGGPRPWWLPEEPTPVADPRPDLTKTLADAYAARWLGRAEYGLINPSRDYSAAMAAAGRVAAQAARANRPEARVVGQLLDALADGWRDGVPPLSALGSDHTWRVTLPAYLKRLYG